MTFFKTSDGTKLKTKTFKTMFEDNAVSILSKECCRTQLIIILKLCLKWYYECVVCHKKRFTLDFFLKYNE